MLNNCRQFSNTEDLFQGDVEEIFSLLGDVCLAIKNSLDDLS